MRKNLKPRLFATQSLSVGSFWEPSESQCHYLLNVMRLNIGDEIKAFDGVNGEFLGEICQKDKKSCSVRLKEKLRDMTFSPDVWLLFAPVKKDKTDFIIAGATELGVARIVPVLTERTITERIKKERYEAQVIEAAEQCRRLDIPQIADAVSLTHLLQNWPRERTLFYMDESGNGADILEIFAQNKNAPAAILVGPEGGFSDAEFALLRQQNFAKAVSLGKRILRAETAVLSALACWQACVGDWRDK